MDTELEWERLQVVRGVLVSQRDRILNACDDHGDAGLSPDQIQAVIGLGKIINDLENRFVAKVRARAAAGHFAQKAD